MARRIQATLDLRGPLALNTSVGTSGQVLTSAGAGAIPTWSSSFISTSSSYFAGHHPEGRFMYNAYLANDMANARLRGATVSATQNGSPYTISNADWDAMFSGKADFLNISPTSGFTFPLVMTISLPRTLTYGTWVGIGFGNSGWRANSVKIEVFSLNSSTWVTVVDTTTNTSEDVFAAVSGLSGGNSLGINQIRYTLSAPNSTQLRIAHLWAYNFNSDMWSQTMMPRAGGSFYGPVTGTSLSASQGLTLSGANSPISLNAGGNGTSGQVLTSSGTAATPTWTTPAAPRTVIQTIALSGTSSIAFTSIPQGYRDLQLIITTSSNNSSAGKLTMTMNGTTFGYNYINQYINGTGAGVVTTAPTSSIGTGQASIEVTPFSFIGAGVRANIEILGYSSTAYKTGTIVSQAQPPAAIYYHNTGSFAFNSTTAVTSLTVAVAGTGGLTGSAVLLGVL